MRHWRFPQSLTSDVRPTLARIEFTRPFCGEIAKSLTNIWATATVGSTTGKKTSVRTSAEARFR